MNVIKKLTFASVKNNKKRGIATVIAIILSTALICGTAGLCTSAVISFQQAAVYQVGDFHLTVENVNRTELTQITENAQVKDFFLTKSLGYGVLDGSINEDKPYVYVWALSSRALSGGWGLHLIEGRMPENENEIVISDHIRSNAGVILKTGDTMNVSLGQRINADGDVLNQNDPLSEEIQEHIIGTKDRSFKIVGVISRPDPSLEDFMAPGYTCFTFASDEELQSADPVNVSFTLKDARTYQRFSDTLFSNLSSWGTVIENTEFLEYSGALSAHTLQFILGVGVIVTLIIMVTSIFVIRNSFAISVSEKTKYYGILASVGATSKQIRKSVLFEGLIFGAIGIPLGIGSGITAIIVLLKIVNALLSDLVNGLEFVYYLPVVFAVVSALLAAVTIFFSALIPAVRAGKIAPVEAVRGNREINVREKEVRVSGLTEKLFGVGGLIAAKNLKRSRKKYRTTVISLVLSVTVFISLSSFVGYMNKSVSNQFEDLSINLTVYAANESVDCEELYSKLLSSADVERYSYYYFGDSWCDAETYGTATTVAEAKKNYEETRETYDFEGENALTEQELKDSFTRMYIIAAVYNDEYFESYLKELGVSDPVEKAAILCDLNSRTKIKAGDEVKLNFARLRSDEESDPADFAEVPLRVSKVVTDGHPMGLEGYNSGSLCLIVSKSFFAKDPSFMSTFPSSLYVKAADPKTAETAFQEIISGDAKYSGTTVYNQETDSDEQKRVILIAEIFLYGFITVITLIGVTNIFNTITTNMNLRQKEFAMLRSVGMTDGEFNRMVRLESLMYGLRSLIIGVPLGVLGGAAFYTLFHDEFSLGYVFPLNAIVISVVFVFIIVGLTMRYSLAKINKQNVIETIRNENT